MSHPELSESKATGTSAVGDEPRKGAGGSIHSGHGDRGVGDPAEDEPFYDTVSIDVVRFNVPPYTGKLRPWFTRLEAQFRAGKIKAAATKFNVVIAQAPEHIIEQLTEEEIETLAGQKDSYDRLKSLLLRRFTPTEDERLSNLLRDVNRPSDDRPSEAYRKILTEAKGLLEEDTVRKMWLMRLPHMIQMFLVNDAHLSMPDLAEKADQYFLKYKASEAHLETAATSTGNPFLPMTAGHPSTSAAAPVATATPPVDPWTTLATALEKLTLEVSALQRDSRKQRPPRNRSRSQRGRSATPGPSTAEENSERICWYHRKFGARANDCRPPCIFDPSTKN